MLLGTLSASLLGYTLIGKGAIRVGDATIRAGRNTLRAGQYF